MKMKLKIATLLAFIGSIILLLLTLSDLIFFIKQSHITGQFLGIDIPHYFLDIAYVFSQITLSLFLFTLYKKQN